MWPWQRSKISKAQTQAEDAIAKTLTGGDSLPAWNAIWDLVQSRDAQGKQEILQELRGYVAESVAGDSIDGVTVAQARAFEQAIDQSIGPRTLHQPATENSASVVRHNGHVPPSNELRRQANQDQIETHRAAMHKIGVRPGDGIPMWALYMTRRDKRSWG